MNEFAKIKTAQKVIQEFLNKLEVPQKKIAEALDLPGSVFSHLKNQKYFLNIGDQSWITLAEIANKKIEVIDSHSIKIRAAGVDTKTKVIDFLEKKTIPVKTIKKPRTLHDSERIKIAKMITGEFLPRLKATQKSLANALSIPPFVFSFIKKAESHRSYMNSIKEDHWPILKDIYDGKIILVNDHTVKIFSDECEPLVIDLSMSSNLLDRNKKSEIPDDLKEYPKTLEESFNLDQKQMGDDSEEHKSSDTGIKVPSTTHQRPMDKAEVYPTSDEDLKSKIEFKKPEDFKVSEKMREFLEMDEMGHVGFADTKEIPAFDAEKIDERINSLRDADTKKLNTILELMDNILGRLESVEKHLANMSFNASINITANGPSN